MSFVHGYLQSSTEDIATISPRNSVTIRRSLYPPKIIKIFPKYSQLKYVSFVPREQYDDDLKVFLIVMFEFIRNLVI